MKILDLSKNEVSSIVEAEGALGALEELNLEGNIIENLLPGTFKSMRNLRVLNLRLNPLITASFAGISPTIENMSVISCIHEAILVQYLFFSDLFDTLLEDLYDVDTIESPARLKSFIVESNFLKCSCALKKFLE